MAIRADLLLSHWEWHLISSTSIGPTRWCEGAHKHAWWLSICRTFCHRGNRPFFTGNINWSLYILSLWLWFLPVSKTFWDVLMHCIYYSSNGNSVSEAQGCLFLSSVTVPLSWCKTADSIWWERSKGLLLSIAQRVALLSQAVTG